MIEPAQHLAVERLVGEIAQVRPEAGRRHHQQFLRRRDLRIAGKLAAEMHLPALRRDAHHRHLDLVEIAARRALVPPRPVDGMIDDLPMRVHRRLLALDRARPGRHRRVIGDPLVHEGGVEDAAGIAGVAVEIAGGVALADAAQMRRLRRGGEILAPAPVGIADHADIAVAPGLRGDPFDQVVAVAALLVVEPAPLALRAAGAARLRDHMHVAVRHVEAGGAGFDGVAPLRRLLLDVLGIRRQRQQHRIAAGRLAACRYRRRAGCRRASRHRHSRRGWRRAAAAASADRLADRAWRRGEDRAWLASLGARRGRAARGPPLYGFAARTGKPCGVGRAIGPRRRGLSPTRPAFAPDGRRRAAAAAECSRR